MTEWQIDDATLIEHCEAMLATWYDDGGQLAFQYRGKPPREGKMLTVFGLAAHAHYVGRAALGLLSDPKTTLAAVPLVRLAYEDAITAQWVAQSDDGAEAFYNEEARSREAAAKDLSATSHVILASVGAEILAKERTRLGTSSDAQARHFKQRCADLTPGGPELYAYYRILCMASHATPHTVERFIVPNEDRSAIAKLSKGAVPEPDEGSWLLYFLALSLVLAGRAVDYQDATKSRRSQLRDIASTIGATSELHLTPLAQKRIADEARIRRRAERKPRRRKR